MREKCKLVNLEGEASFTKDYRCHLFYAHPKGIINPSLLSKDLDEAMEFSNNCEGPWTYCTNTEDVKLVNPLNIFYLKEIKKLKKLKQIVIYAPGILNRYLLKIVSPVLKPDRIITNKVEFEQFLAEVMRGRK